MINQVKMTVAQYYSSGINKIINDSPSKERIFVVQGLDSEVLHLLNSEDVVDLKTILSQNHSDFSRDWFTYFFNSLSAKSGIKIVSYAQFSYVLNYIDASFFRDRVTVITDNIRQLFPLNVKDYVERPENESIEQRDPKTPIHHAEQMKVGTDYYFSLQSLDQGFKQTNIHNEELELDNLVGNEIDQTILDLSDPYSLDLFVNEFLRDTTANKAVLKIHKKKSTSEALEEKARKINFLLNRFGGGLSLQEDDVVEEDFIPSEETSTLLRKYWGTNARFRGLMVYKDPNTSKDVLEISQGLIVETIIGEYENSKQKKPVRDLFLTAPTGAGKSLLFQLPSFHISERGDVTVVVSPLIALMKDQVNAIHRERHFEKVAYLNSELSLIDREKVIDSCKEGLIDVLYMSPELLLSYEVSHFVGDRNIGLLVIDEAHLITTWGRDFRVDYWFLGNHIRKMRKYGGLNFPMIAVTATAVYGGANDMVFDSIDSLAMQNPHIFIGMVKRDDIEFVISNYERFDSHYEKNKLNQTVGFIKDVIDIGLKTLVYTPYTKHIRQILSELSEYQSNSIAGYYGTMDSDLKDHSYRRFKNGDCKVMISTKAFGMGVDISDIQVVYHHAPSGLLPDYVQEIGRAARDPQIQGFAALNYSSQDQRFSKALHGMSALKQAQLREVLKKVVKAYKKDKSRNLLLSIDDFGHIFESSFDLDQKVLTSLMMIEKDYLAKTRYNVLIARPKKLFVVVYSKLNQTDCAVLSKEFGNSVKVVQQQANNVYVELNLDEVWRARFNDKSFPVLKMEYYTGRLFSFLGIEVTPQLKVTFERLVDYSVAYGRLEAALTSLSEAFSEFQGFFTEDDLIKVLEIQLNSESQSKKLAKFILGTFTGRLVRPGVIEDNAFLQKRKSGKDHSYRVFNARYLHLFASMLSRFNRLFQNTDSPVVSTYITNKESNALTYVRLGYILEILDLGTFEMKGGESPMVFIRINDPQRIEKDSHNTSYKNVLLEKTLERHYLSNQIFDHFFLNNFNNEKRWDFIEDFFLGEETDVLISNYQGHGSNNISIIDRLRNVKVHATMNESTLGHHETNIHIFEAKQGNFYNMDDLLTIASEDGVKTMKVSQWLDEDPVRIHTEIYKNDCKLDKNVFNILSNRLKNNHYDYYKSVLGLNVRIEFKGYDKPVKAVVPYKSKPTDFYLWWCENQERVQLSFREKLELFNQVYLLNPQHLKSNHKDLLLKKSR